MLGCGVPVGIHPPNPRFCNEAVPDFFYLTSNVRPSCLLRVFRNVKKCRASCPAHGFVLLMAFGPSDFFYSFLILPTS
jgi:hypothetical protein